VAAPSRRGYLATKTLSGNLARLPDNVLVANKPDPSGALKAREPLLGAGRLML
jgi:hypothetical protein